MVQAPIGFKGNRRRSRPSLRSWVQNCISHLLVLHNLNYESRSDTQQSIMLDSPSSKTWKAKLRKNAAQENRFAFVID